MKIITHLFFIVLIIFILTSCHKDKLSNESLHSDISSVIDNKDIIFGQYIVFFKESKIPSSLKQLENNSFKSRENRANLIEKIAKTSIKEINNILTFNNIEKSKVLNYYTTNISGMAIKLTDKEFDKLASDENVESIQFDREFELPEYEVKKITNPQKTRKSEQITPCGINKVGGFSNGSKKNNWIWIIDSGIDLDHPDLNVITDSKYAKSFAEGVSSPDDDNGHGTHVAGIAAAINNDFGVVGVSAGASVVPLRVFSSDNKTKTSIILSAINHAGKHGSSGDVINLSIGNNTPFGDDCSKNSTLKTSLRSLTRKGMFVTIAAGNRFSEAKKYEPGCINGEGIYTVAGMDCHTGMFGHSYSNYNISYLNPIDLIAVGTDVRSTYINGQYAVMTGTSMAAPHVAGIIHAKGRSPKTSSFVHDNYGRGQTYPIAIRK